MTFLLLPLFIVEYEYLRKYSKYFTQLCTTIGGQILVIFRASAIDIAAMHLHCATGSHFQDFFSPQINFVPHARAERPCRFVGRVRTNSEMCHMTNNVVATKTIYHLHLCGYNISLLWFVVDIFTTHNEHSMQSIL